MEFHWFSNQNQYFCYEKDDIWNEIDQEFKVISQTFVKNQSSDFFNITNYWWNLFYIFLS